MSLINHPELCCASVAPYGVAAAMHKPGVSVGVRPAVRDGQDVIVTRPHLKISGVLVDALLTDAADAFVTLEEDGDQDALRRHGRQPRSALILSSAPFFGMSFAISTGTGVDLFLVGCGVSCRRRVNLVLVGATPHGCDFRDSFTVGRTVGARTSGNLFAVSSAVGGAFGRTDLAISQVVCGMVSNQLLGIRRRILGLVNRNILGVSLSPSLLVGTMRKVIDRIVHFISGGTDSGGSLCSHGSILPQILMLAHTENGEAETKRYMRTRAKGGVR